MTSLVAGPPGRFDGVVLSTGASGEVLLSIPPEVIDHPLAADDLKQLLAVR